MKQKLTPLGSILSKALDNLRPSSDLDMTRIWDLWDTALDQTVAANSKPGAFKDGVLIVHVSSSVWLQHLRFMEVDLKTRLNLALGRPLVKELRFKIASLHS
jgi:predicted nucleic acid-binding Zn ribbon protein